MGPICVHLVPSRMARWASILTPSSSVVLNICATTTMPRSLAELSRWREKWGDLVGLLDEPNHCPLSDSFRLQANFTSLIEKRTLRSFDGQASPVSLTSVVRWDCCPFSLTNEAVGDPGYRANCAGSQYRFDHSCAGIWLAFCASPPAVFYRFSLRSSSS